MEFKRIIRAEGSDVILGELCAAGHGIWRLPVHGAV